MSSEPDLSAVFDDVGPTGEPPTVADLAAELGDVLDDDAVRTLLADRPEMDLRPALRALTVPQLRLLGDLLAGFESRETLLTWGVRALVHSLGELDPEWLAALLSSRAELAVVVDDYPAPDTGTPLPTPTATRMREGLAALDLLPAFRAARHRIRFDVKEWTPGEWDGGVPDGDEQRHPAMLPALTELDKRLVWAVDALLDGFGSTAAFAVWHQEVVEGTFVELDDTLLDATLVSERSLQRVLLADGDVPNARELRLGLVLDELLPAFARAIDARVLAAREHVEETAAKDTAPGL